MNEEEDTSPELLIGFLSHDELVRLPADDHHSDSGAQCCFPDCGVRLLWLVFCFRPSVSISNWFLFKIKFLFFFFFLRIKLKCKVLNISTGQSGW
jgi:hypothetical protein